MSQIPCPRCDQPVDVKSRHVVVSGSSVKLFCSKACRDGISVIEAPMLPQVDEPPRRTRWWIAAGFVFGGAVVAAAYITQSADDTPEEPAYATWLPPPPVIAQPAPTPDAAPSVDDEIRRADEALQRELMHDAWIHPLEGPARRMPTNHMHAFGAARAVDPPPECFSGHCGVDIGVGEPGIWGERVLAVHEGVVAWVDRGPNEEYGGAFVKIAHRDSTLFSWYFHLAAVPRWIRPGVKVKVGQVIGLLGDTGLKDPVAHLHFAMSVKPPKAQRERYLDPEPLIAIWPLWLPSGNTARVSTEAPPGLPIRSYHQRRPVKKAAVAPAVQPSPPEPTPEPPAETPLN